MERLPCLILAPFYGKRELDQILNIARATTLARLALAQGFAPVMRHATHPLLFLKGADDLDALHAGQEWSEALVDLVAHRKDGRAWILETDDGGLPPDVIREVNAWDRVKRRDQVIAHAHVRRGTWDSYGPDLVAYGLEDFHRALEASTFMGLGRER